MMTEKNQNFSNNPFKVYVDYLALKRHFQIDNQYNYFKYNGKIKASSDAFTNRKDYYHFAKLSKKDDPHNILVANLCENDKEWIGDISSEKGYEKYIDWKSRQDSITYHFKTQLNNLNDDFKSNFKVTNGQHPYILQLYIKKTISLETFSILVNMTNVIDYWNSKIEDIYYGIPLIKRSQLYQPFLQYDEEKLKNIVKDKFIDNK